MVIQDLHQETKKTKKTKNKITQRKFGCIDIPQEAFHAVLNIHE